jgi:hypothetical protein
VRVCYTVCMITVRVPSFDLDSLDNAALWGVGLSTSKPLVFIGYIDNVKRLIVITHATESCVISGWQYITRLYELCGSVLCVICCYPGVCTRRSYTFGNCILGTWLYRTACIHTAHELQIMSESEWLQRSK